MGTALTQIAASPAGTFVSVGDVSESMFRQMRATAFALAARDCDPDDAAQLATALLIDLQAGMPDGAGFVSVRDDAKWWASLATPVELVEVLAATLERLQDRALHRNLRKRLFMLMWRSFGPKDQAAFLAYATGEARQ